MAVKVRKPILVAGIGLSFALWLWEDFHQEVAAAGEWAIAAAMAIGMGLWLLRRQSSPPDLLPDLSPLKRETVGQAIAEAQASIALLEAEAPERDVSALKQRLGQLPEGFQRQALQVAIAGGKKVGKTVLKHLLAGQNFGAAVQFVEAEVEGTAALACDLALFLVEGDLTDSEWQVLQQWRAARQRLVLVFNKQDRYLPEERNSICQQLQQRVQGMLPEGEVIPIAAAPHSITVRQYREDGSRQEWQEPQAADIGSLGDRLRQILSQEREQLVWGTIWREARSLEREAKQELNEVRRQRALPIVERYQWVAAVAAFANPVATLDLLAVAAIDAQMLVELSAVYQQKFSLARAQVASGTLGKLMVQLGLVELSTQTIGSLLKSNAVTYVAGGAVQGVSAAYLTRLAGLSSIEYFQEQEANLPAENSFNWEKLEQKLKQVFEQNQRSAFLQGFAQQLTSRLSEKTWSSAPPA